MTTIGEDRRLGRALGVTLAYEFATLIMGKEPLPGFDEAVERWFYERVDIELAALAAKGERVPNAQRYARAAALGLSHQLREISASAAAIAAAGEPGSQ